MKKETDKFTLELVDDNYFELVVKDDAEMTVEDIDILVALQLELGGGQRFPVIIVPSSSAYTDSDLLKHISIDKNLPYSIADAFVITSIPHRILGNLYKRLNPNKRPTGFFKSKEEALKWIRSL